MTPGTSGTSLPPPLHATSADLPPPVAAALRGARFGSGGVRGTVEAAGIPFATESWGEAEAAPVLLGHGVTSAAGIWWRTGPALAAAGYRVVAVDLPGHGRTRTWSGRHRFRETAADLAAYIRASGLDESRLAVVGHSWGGMVAAALPAAGIRPRVLVLLDPPALPLPYLEAMTQSPEEWPYETVGEAVAVVRAAHPAWDEGDVLAKADGLTRFVPEAALAILLENGDWDGGLADLLAPAAQGVPAWYLRGEPASGGLIPDEAVPALAARVGPGHVITIADAPHSPMRTHPEATVLALLRALRE